MYYVLTFLGGAICGIVVMCLMFVASEATLEDRDW